MGHIVAGNQTALVNAVTDLQNEIATLGTKWTALLAALDTARTLDDGSKFIGARQGNTYDGTFYNINDPRSRGISAPGSLRLDDVVGAGILARLATDCMLANGMRAILQAFIGQTGTGKADIASVVNTLTVGL